MPCSSMPALLRRRAASQSCPGHDFQRRGAIPPGRNAAARCAPRRGRRLSDAPGGDAVDKQTASLEGEGPLPLRNRALIELVYSAGLRSAEAVGLDLADVAFEHPPVHVRPGPGCKDPVV